MKNFYIEDDTIIVEDGFDAKSTLFSGQIFRVKTLCENKFLVSTGNEFAIVEVSEKTTIKCTDVNYFVNFFDLENDYSKFLPQIKDAYALSAIGFSPKLKIMRQEKFETVIDFVMSANNNIKRFSKTLEKIAEKYGEKREFCGFECFTFPTPQKLSTASLQELKDFGCGYRDRYIVETSKAISNGFDLNSISNLDTISANKKLCELMGIGEKVADCILLFAYQKYDAFPVDTWIERLYHENYDGESTNRKEIRKFFVDKFGEYAGIVQQYLFHFKRN